MIYTVSPLKFYLTRSKFSAARSVLNLYKDAIGGKVRIFGGNEQSTMSISNLHYSIIQFSLTRAGHDNCSSCIRPKLEHYIVTLQL